MVNVVKLRNPTDGLYFDSWNNRIALNGQRNWWIRRHIEWKRSQGANVEDSYHYEHNVLVLPKEYLT